MVRHAKLAVLDRFLRPRFASEPRPLGSGPVFEEHSVSLSRREFALGSLASILLPKKPAQKRPNIVLIVADGLGSWMLGCYGNKEIRTSNINLLARQGTRLNNFACAPVSSAGLQTLLTGRTPLKRWGQDL